MDQLLQPPFTSLFTSLGNRSYSSDSYLFLKWSSFYIYIAPAFIKSLFCGAILKLVIRPFIIEKAYYYSYFFLLKWIFLYILIALVFLKPLFCGAILNLDLNPFTIKKTSFYSYFLLAKWTFFYNQKSPCLYKTSFLQGFFSYIN
ncbi:hypothetical protein BGZ63DRAFT_266744 [Mariannaea sp. PMI_226]|nr:hypothetical protein BGZ63DRAFT_266744 [Mariannaea sp. PMI_226]